MAPLYRRRGAAIRHVRHGRTRDTRQRPYLCLSLLVSIRPLSIFASFQFAHTPTLNHTHILLHRLSKGSSFNISLFWSPLTCSQATSPHRHINTGDRLINLHGETERVRERDSVREIETNLSQKIYTYQDFLQKSADFAELPYPPPPWNSPLAYYLVSRLVICQIWISI